VHEEIISSQEGRLHDGVSCIILAGHWCDIVLNVYASVENRSDVTRDRRN
jgi:hypothetical protein